MYIYKSGTSPGQSSGQVLHRSESMLNLLLSIYLSLADCQTLNRTSWDIKTFAENTITNHPPTSGGPTKKTNSMEELIILMIVWTIKKPPTITSNKRPSASKSRHSLHKAAVAVWQRVPISCALSSTLASSSVIRLRNES